MSENARRDLRDISKRDTVARLSRTGSWWLALAVVCAVGLAVVGVLAFVGRPAPSLDPASGPLAGGSHSATRGVAGASATTPAGSVSSSPVQAGLISSPQPARAPRPSSWPAPSEQPSPSPAASPPPFVTLNPASGSATLTPPPTWSASACPAGYQTSAVLYELNANGTIASSISNTVSSVTAPFGGTLDGPVKALITLGSDVGPGETSQWVVGCFAGAGGTGARKLAGSVYVTLSADGSSYTSSATAG